MPNKFWCDRCGGEFSLEPKRNEHREACRIWLPLEPVTFELGGNTYEGSVVYIVADRGVPPVAVVDLEEPIVDRDGEHYIAHVMVKDLHRRIRKITF